MSSRKQRGADTQRTVAQFFREHGWPFATAVGAGASGRDVDNMPGLAPEVKARRDYNPTAWLKQAAKNGSDDLAFVVHRPDGYGPEKVAHWPVTLTLRDFAELLAAAGYGDGAP